MYKIGERPGQKSAKPSFQAYLNKQTSEAMKQITCITQKTQMSQTKREMIEDAQEDFMHTCMLAYNTAKNLNLNEKAFETLVKTTDLILPDWSIKTKTNYLVFDNVFDSFVFREMSDENYEMALSQVMKGECVFN
jgi:hypothetical protein